jgi:hypothetical protein
MRAAVRVVLLTAAFALVTRALGWWSVPLVAAAWALMDRGAPRAPWDAALAAALAWALFLAWLAVEGPLGYLLHLTAEIFPLPAAALLAITLLYAASLAWSAATLASALTRPWLSARS